MPTPKRLGVSVGYLPPSWCLYTLLKFACHCVFRLAHTSQQALARPRSAVTEREFVRLLLCTIYGFALLSRCCRHSHDPEVLQRHVVKRLTPSLEQQILFHAVGKHAVAVVNKICGCKYQY